MSETSLASTRAILDQHTYVYLPSIPWFPRVESNIDHRTIQRGESHVNWAQPQHNPLHPRCWRSSYRRIGTNRQIYSNKFPRWRLLPDHTVGKNMSSPYLGRCAREQLLGSALASARVYLQDYSGTALSRRLYEPMPRAYRETLRDVVGQVILWPAARVENSTSVLPVRTYQIQDLPPP